MIEKELCKLKEDINNFDFENNMIKILESKASGNVLTPELVQYKSLIKRIAQI